MARTTRIPTTLDEYRNFVRSEALKVQKDMGWPDEKMNATLVALGLPPKLDFQFMVTVKGETMAMITVSDTLSEEEARARLAAMTPDEVQETVARTVSMGGFHAVGVEQVEMPTTFAVGDSDTTMANAAIYTATPRGERAQCEQYSTGGGNYCTRKRGHEGMHAAGNGTTIRAAWDRA